MFAVMGVTGNAGSATAKHLLAAGKKVRAVVLDAKKGAAWAERGCEIAIADTKDAPSLKAAFEGVEGAFAMFPPVFDPSPDFAEAHAMGASLRRALSEARVPKTVYLSTIGADATEPNLLTQHYIVEKALNDVRAPIAFLRPTWFMENFLWDVQPARDAGVLNSFLYPLDKAFPMVATEDIGRVAAELLQQDVQGHTVVELEGPRRYSPNDVASAFGEVLGRGVRAELVPRGKWEELFRQQGMTNPGPRARMLDGFNEGWIAFQNEARGARRGEVEIKGVLRALVQRAG